jgi:t-SNARE complex subunit (syntaxin)
MKGRKVSQPHNALEKMKLQLKLDDEIKVLEEGEYMDNVIDERQRDIDQIGKIMGDVRELAQDFNQELNTQAYKIEDLENNNEAVADNTGEAYKQIKEANQRSKKNG